MTDTVLPEFKAFPKIPRRNRVVIVTEKIDGTNGIVYVSESGEVTAGGRARWLVDGADNYGFAAWVKEHEGELRGLGPGYHYGEWWGQGIQRRYGLNEKRFSLFNVGRWSSPDVRPPCCHVVPVLASGYEKDGIVDECLQRLVKSGSLAAPGFMRPEGIVVFHTISKTLHKVTIEKDSEPKGSEVSL